MSASKEPVKFAPSYDTAICLLPPDSVQASIDRVRNVYDKAFEKWPPHVNLLYPFVRPEDLQIAARALCDADISVSTPRSINLQEADFFRHRNHNTVFLRPRKDHGSAFASTLVACLRRTLGWPSRDDYQPHLTIGQSKAPSSDFHKFLLDKARLMTTITWEIKHLFILIRDSSSSSHNGQPMKVWGRINLDKPQVERLFNTVRHAPLFEQEQPTFAVEVSSKSWRRAATESTSASSDLRQLIVASYNVLAEFQWPPSPARYPLLLSNILSERAAADVLVLQEVTDHFLPYLLRNRDISSQYPFSTHGPPDLESSGPLPAFLNIVVFSKLPFTWTYLPLSSKQKGAAVLKFVGSCVKTRNNTFTSPIILAACHFTQGLTDVAVASKRNEISRLKDFLSGKFPDHPWVVAGDLNLASSTHTVDQARKQGHLSPSGYRTLCEIDEIIADLGLHDAWLLTRLRHGVSQDATGSTKSLVDLHEGEQGATFDPMSNSLAAAAVADRLDNRPQRYDRILFNDALSMVACGFNSFGHPHDQDHCEIPVASDHWGVRCLFRRTEQVDDSHGLVSQRLTILSKKAAPSLGDTDELKTVLASLGCLPTVQDQAVRANALSLLERVLCCNNETLATQEQRSVLDVVLIPVGSYGLGVWTADSDVDCLCIGHMSSKNFFSLALSKLRKSKADGIHVLRTVKAKTGMMLELNISGIMFDLQYCSAGLIAERYPSILNHPAMDLAFDLPSQTLAKLKPARDLAYLQRSIPDMTKYRLAHLFIKAWAKSRGLYSAKFGMLSGINLSVLLVPVCKALACVGGSPSTADILVTFFHHYASFDWRHDAVSDTMFHTTLKYHRTVREALCLLGWYAPSLNTALNASPATVKRLATELCQARALLSQELVDWNGLLQRDDITLTLPALTARNASKFLRLYEQYVKIDAHYWGSSTAKGRRFIGWLESRCITVLIEISRKIPALMTHIWPAKFGPEASHPDSVGEDFQLSYLIGLSWENKLSGAQTKGGVRDQQESEEQALSAILRDFESRIRGDEKYFEQGSCWVMTSVVGAKSVSCLRTGLQTWTEDRAGDTDSEEDFDTDEYDDLTSQQEERPSGMSGTSKRRGQPIAKPAGSGKLRTATDVMNRLRWDPALDSGDYLVGYEDRFVGAREKLLDQWKTEQTDEEFIPQHRILYFKKISDGTIIWERRRRIDNLFGSGL